MVLGAGLGSRLKPFTEQLPKPLIPLLGVPCIDYSLLSLKDFGITDVTVNVHAHADQMRAHLRAFNALISDESALLLGSAGGFRKALAHFQGNPFISMNADVISCVDLESLVEAHATQQVRHDVWMTLVLAQGRALDQQKGSYREIFVDEKSGLVTGFGEKKNQIPFYTGTAIFDPRCFTHLTEGVPAEFVPDVLEPLIKKNKVAFIYSESLWMDIGSAELWHQSHFDLLHAYQAGILPASWRASIEQGLKKVHLSEADRVVDYDGHSRNPEKNYIRLKGTQYAV